MGTDVSERQRSFLLSLAHDRVLAELGDSPELRQARVVTLVDDDPNFGRRDASSLIERLLAAPRSTDRPQPAVSGDTRTVTARVGVYRLNGRTYVVRQSRNDKSRVYALELVNAPARVMESGEVRNLELEYRRGLIYELTDAHRLDGEEVERVSRTYGRCIMCGQKLKAAKSVQRAIGPVCWKRVS
jgi:hypothetical protein